MFTEAQLPQAYSTHIAQFWQQSVEQGKLQSKDALEIAYAYAINPENKGTVVISAGRIEAYIKYKEVIFDIYQQGYSVFIHDHRGQGFSGRMTDNPHMGYVDDFDDYVRDLHDFMQQVVRPHCQQQPLLLGHSMGCAIAVLYCLAYPQAFKKVAFSAPMFGIRPALPTWFANLLVKSHFALGRVFGRQYGYFIGQRDYVEHAFANNRLTHSAVRYQIFRDEYKHHPQAQLGGVTAHWLHAAAVAMNRIEQSAPLFPLPSLILQAGADAVVDNARQSRVASMFPGCQLQIIPGARHELLMEADEYRQPTLAAILDFFAK
ncbi:MAG: alpha/beta fold hydrolase [Paraglaciecola sp.]|nr:alpha/beta fold hydrolase [Paraglaciecola sp.]NCT48673.1 alpha/beta fold hydrolase [Paraglaciecola sp.]